MKIESDQIRQESNSAVCEFFLQTFLSCFSLLVDPILHSLLELAIRHQFGEGGRIIPPCPW